MNLIINFFNRAALAALFTIMGLSMISGAVQALECDGETVSGEISGTEIFCVIDTNDELEITTTGVIRVQGSGLGGVALKLDIDQFTAGINNNGNIGSIPGAAATYGFGFNNPGYRFNSAFKNNENSVIQGTFGGIYLGDFDRGIGGGFINTIDNAGSIITSQGGHAIAVGEDGEIGAIINDGNGAEIKSAGGVFIAAQGIGVSGGKIGTITNQQEAFIRGVSITNGGEIERIANTSGAEIGYARNNAGDYLPTIIATGNNSIIQTITNTGSGSTIEGFFDSQNDNNNNGAYAIFVEDGGSIGTLTNSEGASLHSGRYAIYITGENSSISIIDNDSAIASLSQLAGSAIRVDNGGSIDEVINRNNGVIQGIDYGIELEDSDITNNITNSGTIDRISLNNGSSVGGNITNNAGTIKGITLTDNDIGSASSVNGSITNIGGVINGNGISLTGSSIGGDISNNNGGEIDGISLTDSTVDGAIMMTIDGTGTVGGTINGNIELSGSTIDDGIILNNGSTIDGSVDNNNSAINDFGIFLDNASEITGVIRNTNEGSIAEVTLVNGSVITNNGGAENAIDVVNSDITLGILISDSSSISGNIGNDGGLIGDGSTEDLGIIVQNNSRIEGSITNKNSGTISQIIVNTNSTITGNINNDAEIGGGSEGQGIGLTDSAIEGNIENTGQITGAAFDGISLSNSTVAAINNNTASSTIDGELAGIAAFDGSVIGSIDNQGTLSGDQAGILLANTGTQITQGVTNGGSITGTANIGEETGAGILLIDEATIFGDIENTGTITGTGEAIALKIGSEVIGNINNESAITGGDFGILLQDNSTVTGTITNSADANITGTTAAGILLQGGFINNGINNETDATINGELAGIYLQPYENGSTIDSQIQGGVNNDGTIRGETGIFLEGDSTLAGGISNQGLIDGDSIGIVNQGTINGGIDNEGGHISGDTGIFNLGTIQGNTLAAAIWVHDGGEISEIDNLGTITGTIGILLTGDDSSIGDTLTNYGIIEGTDGVAIGLSSSNQTITLNHQAGDIFGDVLLDGSTINLVDGDIAGDVIADTVIVSGDSTARGSYQVNTFTIDNTGIFTGDGVTIDSDVDNAGMLVATVGEDVIITGDYLQTGDDGTLAIAIDNNNSDGYGRIIVNGDADISSNNRFSVRLVSGATLQQDDIISDALVANNILSEEYPQVLQIDNDDYLLNIDNDSYLLNFVGRVVADGDQDRLEIKAVSGNFAADAVRNAGLNYATGVAEAMDTIFGEGATGDMLAVISELNFFSTERQVANAIAQMVPVLIGQSTQVAKQTINELTVSVNDRIGMLRGLPAGDQLALDRRFWIKPFITRAHQDDVDGVPGYDAQSTGFSLGADQEIANWLLGFALGYYQADIDGNTINTNKVDIEGYQAALYTSLRMPSVNRDFMDIVLMGGSNNNKSTRRIQFGSGQYSLDRTAKGDYDTDFARAYVGVGQDFWEYDNPWTLSYVVSGAYTYVNDASYTETGAGDLNLHVQSASDSDKDSTDSLVVAIDTILTYRWYQPGQFENEQFTFRGRIGVGYDLLADQSIILANFVNNGPIFATRGIDPEPFMARAGVSAEYKPLEQLLLQLYYDVQGNQEFINQIVSADLRWAF